MESVFLSIALVLGGDSAVSVCLSVCSLDAPLLVVSFPVSDCSTHMAPGAAQRGLQTQFSFSDSYFLLFVTFHREAGWVFGWGRTDS